MKKLVLIILGVMMFAKPVLAKKAISKARAQIAQIRANLRHSSIPRPSKSIRGAPRISSPRISVKSGFESRINRSFKMPRISNPSRSIPSRSIKDFRSSPPIFGRTQKFKNYNPFRTVPRDKTIFNRIRGSRPQNLEQSRNQNWFFRKPSDSFKDRTQQRLDTLRERLHKFRGRDYQREEQPEPRKKKEYSEPREQPREHRDSRDGYYYRRHYYVRYPYPCTFYSILWPDCYYPIYYGYGPYPCYWYIRPYYHRRYVFVSLGGWWPYYPYIRYYWYPCHPYTWYGWDLPPYRMYNYYTYNYYNDDAPPNEEQQPPPEPNEPTQADYYFEKAVKAFEAGNYATAAIRFQEAMKLAPDDVILPFAYAQALFAKSQYQKAAEVLREALNKTEPEKEGVFYPRGLYPDEKILEEQIEKLKQVVSSAPSNPDLQLLLGYQLLGIGKFDEAIKPLEKAQSELLINLLEKLQNAKENKKE